MWQEDKDKRLSPFDCVVCGACVYGNNLGIRICLPCKSFYKRHSLLPPNTLKCHRNGQCYIERTQRYFSSDIPPCRACRLQKCLSVGMNENLIRPRSASSPPLALDNTIWNNNNNLIKTSSLDEHSIPSNKQLSSDFNSKTNNDKITLDRIRCLSDATDRQRLY